MSDKVHIIIWNKYSVIQTNAAILKTVHDYLSYTVSGRMGKQVTYSYLTSKGSLKTGFLSEVIPLLRGQGCTIDITDNRSNKYVVESLVTKFPMGELRDDQIKVLEKAFEHPFWYRGIVDAATNFGKNWVITGIVKTALLHNSKVVITIHRQELFNQLYDILTEAGVEVSRWGAHKNKTYRELGDVTLIMYKSMVSNINDTNVINHLRGVGTILVDEAHRSQAAQYSKVLSNIDAFAVFFLSGTPFTGANKHDLGMIGDAGSNIIKITNQELIDKGVSQKPTVYIKFLKVDTNTGLNYEDEMSAMVYSKEKNSFLIDLIKESPDTPTLVVVKFREHGNILLDKLLIEGVSVDYIHGESKDREFLIDAFKSGSIKVLITTEVLKEGVNIPNIRRLVNLAAGKSIVWVKQFVGRLLRSDGVHTDCEVYDFIDVGTHLRDQSLKRLLFYEKEGFDIVNL